MLSKLLICNKCGETIIGIEHNEAIIRSRIFKFSQNGTPYAKCKGSTGTGKPCKNDVTIPKKTMLNLMNGTMTAV